MIEPAMMGRLAEGDGAQAIAAITLGFAADPVLRRLWPGAAGYLAAMPGFIAGYGGGAFGHGTADVSGCGRAAALWLPPGAAPDSEALGGLLAASVAPEVLGELGAMMGAVRAMKPAGPLWYLTMIGCDPAAQGVGVGTALLRRGLARCDAAGGVAYLEASSPRNAALYARHGFVRLGEAAMGGGAALVPMVRPPAG